MSTATERKAMTKSELATDLARLTDLPKAKATEALMMLASGTQHELFGALRQHMFDLAQGFKALLDL